MKNTSGHSNISPRRGSALLVVLGMLAFMVISAVSFAIFMRQGRTPSSYLRRNSSARYLLKAALANAISRLDGQLATFGQIGNENLGLSTSSGLCEGVYDDPYPGVNAELVERNGDYWVKRVFCPFGEVDPAGTVSTLTLEGLAYLPPAIINEARLYSRRTRTAVWRNLAYDAGRYAFCAIDVSDCFDINRLYAAERRLSSSGDRISLASLFPDNADKLGEILEKCSNHDGGGNIPFVSVADFNLVAGNNAFAPFYRYIGTSGSAIYNSSDYETVSNALFITDTWFPPTNATATVKRINLEAGDDKQPFRSYTDSANFLTPAKNATELCNILQKNIGGVGLAALYDYLDKDSRPISFVVPTVETVPMVVGVGLAHNNKFTPTVTPGTEIVSKEIQKGNDPNVTYKYKSTKYTLTKLMDAMMLTGVVTFPFKRAVTGKNGFNGSFTGEALVRVFFGPPTIKSRLDASSPLYPSKASDWTTGYDRGVMTVKCPISGISFASDVKTTQDAVKQFNVSLSAPGSVNAPLFYLVKEVKVQKDPETGNTTETETENKYYSLDGIKGSQDAMVPRDADGNEMSWWTSADASSAEPAADGDEPKKATLGADEFVPHVLVWVRIMNGSDTVDIVPARIDDDALWGASAFNAQGMGGKFGDGTPVLEFRGDAARAFVYTADDANDKAVTKQLDGQAETFPAWTQIYAVDPRYNHAPENWFAMKGNGDATPDEWRKAIGADDAAAGGVLGSNDRDRDIFMFTSDQEVMQSIGELAFLPYVQEMDGTGAFFENDYLNDSNFSGRDFADRGVCLASGATLSSSDMVNGKFASAAFMWRTYSAFPTSSGGGYDPIYTLYDGSTPVEIVAGENDFRLNPFSRDSRILLAALKDTPFDYSVASDSEDCNKTIDFAPSQRAKFAFCKESSVAKLDDDELLDIADRMYDQFGAWGRRTSADRCDWEAAFRNLDWCDGKCNDNQKSLFGLEDFNEPLHGVDRKFLYSFWRECFQNRQQLFLVFLRAEPLTVGGMGEGSLAASQLGARGVALVWRDPQPPAMGTRPVRGSLTSPSAWKQYFENCAPHRTRVLFYHQFD